MRIKDYAPSQEERLIWTLLTPFRSVLTVEPRLLKIYLEEVQNYPVFTHISLQAVLRQVEKLKDWGWAAHIKHDLVGTDMLQLSPQISFFLHPYVDRQYASSAQLGYIWYYRLLAQKLRLLQQSSRGEDTAIAHDFIHLESSNFHHALHLALGVDERTFVAVLGILFFHYSRIGRYNNTIALCRSLLSQHHDAEGDLLQANHNQLGLVYYYLSIAFRENGQLEESEGMLRLAAQINEKAPQESATLAVVLEQVKLAAKKLDFASVESLSSFLDHTSPTPQSKIAIAEMYALRGLANERMGKYEQAEAYFHHALSIFQDKEELPPQSTIALNELGSFYLNQRRYQEAEKMFRQALTINLEHTERPVQIGMSRINLGISLAALGRRMEAARQYHQAIALLHDHAQIQGEVYHNLSNLALQDQDHEAAESYAHKAIKLYKDERKKADVYYNLGVILRELGPSRLEEAIAYFKRTADLYQAHQIIRSLEAVYEELCHCYAELKDWNNAISYALKSQEYAQDTRNLISGSLEIAQLYALQAKWEEARKWIQKAYDMIEGQADAQELMGLFLKIFQRLQQRFTPLQSIVLWDQN